MCIHILAPRLTCKKNHGRMKIMRLRVPSNWKMIKNAFFDVEYEARNGKLFPKAVLVEDILSMQYKDTWNDPPSEKNFFIDLGWYPDESPEGHYRLVLLQDNWNDILISFESRDRFVIREKLENWLDLVNRASNRTKLENWLHSSLD